MNKPELVDALSVYYGGSRAEASRALSAVLLTISRATAAGERVSLTGFGVFERVERPARLVRNPRTGERVQAAATAVPRFRPGAELRAYVAGERPLPDLPSAAPADAASTTAPRPPRVTEPAPVASDAAPSDEPAAGKNGKGAKPKPENGVGKAVQAGKAGKNDKGGTADKKGRDSKAGKGKAEKGKAEKGKAGKGKASRGKG